MINLKNKKGAMEMSVGTIVTIVLLMSVLVLGIFLVQNVFDLGSSAVDSIGTEMDSQINQLFSDEESNMVVYPASKKITIKRGDDPAGFVFKIKNDQNEKQDFEFIITATGESKIKEKCGSAMTIDKANQFLLTDSGSFPLGAGAMMTDGELILFDTPKEAPACTIVYQVDVEGNLGFVESRKVFVTFK